MTNKLEEIESYVSYKHLYVSENQNKVIFLGYELHATKTEYSILKTLAKHSDAPLSAEQIARYASLDCANESIVYHISNINQKAKLIGNRILIKNITKIGYFLNEEM